MACSAWHYLKPPKDCTELWASNLCPIWSAEVFGIQGASGCLFSSTRFIQKIILFCSVQVFISDSTLSCLNIFCRTLSAWCSLPQLCPACACVCLCSVMNRCLRTCFIFMLENKRVKETHLVLELKAACL